MGKGMSEINSIVAMFEEGQHIQAKSLACKYVRKKPSSAVAWNVIGVVASAEKKEKEARAAFKKLVSLCPNLSIAWANFARSCFQTGNFAEALEAITTAIKLEPNQAAYYDIYIIVVAEVPETRSDRLNFAIEMLVGALQKEGNSSALLIALHKVWVAKGNIEQSINSGLLAIGCDPNNLQLKISFAGFLFRNARVSQAAKLYAEVAQEDPKCAEAWLGFGACHHDMASFNIAREAYEAALSIDPQSVGANKNLATLLAYGREFELAIDHISKVVELAPDGLGAKLQLLAYRRNICDWKSSKDEAEIESQLLEYSGSDASPFQALAIQDSPELQLSLGRKWRGDKQRGREISSIRVKQKAKIRVGWFSNDFHDHATMFLLAGVFREYNKDRFEFFVYSYGTHKTGGYRKCLQEQVDKFECFAQKNDESIIKTARGDDLDIAIDLKGYTNGGRHHIFAQGVAPVQVAYLGYPGTLGSANFDYMIADKIVVPDEFRKFYSERIMYMPHCYQPNDCDRKVSKELAVRFDHGLPNKSIVFGCFNQSYKISERELNLWAILLDEVPDSVLWLYVTNDTAKGNLSEELIKRGVKADRLIFAGQVENSEHLARCKLVDIFLDCFNVNAHTTASDALWAGVPMVTRPGRQFASRVAASILTAAGLRNLVAKTDEEYLDIALKLSWDDDYRKQVRNQVIAARESSHLFDTVEYTRDLESLLRAVFDNMVNEIPPCDIKI